MNKNLLIGLGVVVLVVAGIAGYVLLNSPNPITNPIYSNNNAAITETAANSSVLPQPGVPTVQTATNPAPYISTVVVTGNVTPNGALTDYWYQYGTTTALGQQTVQYAVGSGWVSTYTPAYITGLRANTTYYYRLSAQNRFGIVNGATYSFTTNNNPAPEGIAPTTKTDAATEVSNTTANLNGQLNPNGSESTYWFEYGQTTDLGFTTAFQSMQAGNAETGLSVPISNLAAATKYYFRLDAQNQYGTVNGAILSFTTHGPAAATAPTVKTGSAGDTASTTVTLNGSVNPNGATTTYWFEYSDNALLANVLGTASGTNAVSGDSTVQVSANVSGLKANTKYYFRLIARNQFGVISGDIMSFKTKP